MESSITFMEKEAAQAPFIIEKQQTIGLNTLSQLLQKLSSQKPNFAATIARGSSDHAATFAKYAIETNLGLITASLSPSIHTLYKAQVNYKDSLVIGISQSGKSDDLVECMSHARKNGAITLSFVNEENSPLANESEYFIPLLAEKEISVAATKSFIASLARIIQLIAYWNNSSELKNNLITLPSLLKESNNNSSAFSLGINSLKEEQSILVVGRGYSFPIALESALKFKETCGLHAEAFSGAEILHGPFELVKKDFPIFVYLQNDESLPSMLQLIEKIKTKKAKLFVMGASNLLSSHTNNILQNTILFPTANSLHPLCDMLALISTFYSFAAQLAKARGRNPDTPQNLNKVTRTI